MMSKFVQRLRNFLASLYGDLGQELINAEGLVEKHKE